MKLKDSSPGSKAVILQWANLPIGKNRGSSSSGRDSSQVVHLNMLPAPAHLAAAGKSLIVGEPEDISDHIVLMTIVTVLQCFLESYPVLWKGPGCVVEA